MKVFKLYIIFRIRLVYLWIIHFHPGNLRCAVCHRTVLLDGLMEHVVYLPVNGPWLFEVRLHPKLYLITGLVQQGPSCWLPTW